MSDVNNQVADNVVVGLDYTLRLDDGSVVDSSEGRDPLEFLQGQGQIIPGLEKELYGMSVGDAKSVTVQPAEGYGEINENAYQMVPSNAVPAGMELQPGMEVQVQDQQGRPLPARVAEVKDEGVVLDFNHPLAGQTLHFDVEIASLRTASPEELDHGHAHGNGHEHE